MMSDEWLVHDFVHDFFKVHNDLRHVVIDGLLIHLQQLQQQCSELPRQR
mgnify:FL=1